MLSKNGMKARFLEEGRTEEGQELLRRLARKRFKKLPPWREGWMQSQKAAKLEQAIEELIDAQDEQDWKVRLDQL